MNNKKNNSWSVNYSIGKYPVISLTDCNGVIQTIKIEDYVNKVITEKNEELIKIINYFIKLEGEK